MLALAAVLTNGSPKAMALEQPPIEFTLSPRSVEPGHPITIRIVAAPPPRWTGGGPLDVYIMWSTTDRAAFLTPAGKWSPIPVAFRRAMDSGSPVTSMQWKPEPPGELPLAMVAVSSGADPLVRSNWQFQPVLRSARVVTATRGAPVDVPTAAALLAATVLAIAVVAALPRLRK